MRAADEGAGLDLALTKLRMDDTKPVECALPSHGFGPIDIRTRRLWNLDDWESVELRLRHGWSPERAVKWWTRPIQGWQDRAS
jgi:hypothetical protein